MSIIKLPLLQFNQFQSATLFSLGSRAPGTYRLPLQIVGNSILSSLLVTEMDVGASIKVNYFQTTTGDEVNERSELQGHAIRTTVNSDADTIIVARAHFKPICEVIITGGNVKFGIMGTMISAFSYTDGVFDAVSNSNPTSVGLIASERTLTPDESTQIKRLTAISSGTKTALDVSLHDENGIPYSRANPIQVVVIESEGTEINNHFVSASVSSDAQVNLDYTASVGNKFQFSQFHGSASGRAKFEIKTESGPSTGVFLTRFVLFNSSINPNVEITLKENIEVPSGTKVRVTITNRDNQSQDVYATISGHEESI